jgi:hypothetical protein
MLFSSAQAFTNKTRSWMRIFALVHLGFEELDVEPAADTGGSKPYEKWGITIGR